MVIWAWSRVKHSTTELLNSNWAAAPNPMYTNVLLVAYENWKSGSAKQNVSGFWAKDSILVTTMVF